ncbi:fungal-specific transcription factor domain-containing protein [Aspergillus similis]
MRTLPAPRAELRYRHLTAVETRLNLLEAALAKLFPAGDIVALAQDLLLGNDPINDVVMADTFTSGSPINSALAGNDILQNHEPVTDIALLTAQEQMQFVENYFTQYHVLAPLLNEESFRRDLRSPSLPLPRQLLVQMVLAIGAWLTPQVRDGLDTELFLQAKDQFQRIPIANHADISVLQALLLLGDFAQKQGSAEESEYYIGTALRIAMTLNLHTEPPLSLGRVEQEIRRRVWWSAYCAESCSAKMYGRPLLLPEDNLITVNAVSNIHDRDLTASLDGQLPAQTDSPTIYTGLIRQSSYHRMANQIYRRLLSTPAITHQDVYEAEQIINAWHHDSSLSEKPRDLSSQPEWYFTARHRQILCDQSLRLLIHRPMLLRWLRGSPATIGPGHPDNAEAARCRAQGLKIARTTTAMIVNSLSTNHYSRLNLAFTLYAVFHALIVLLIHVKKDPCSSVSISCMQDLGRAQAALDHLPIEGDALSGHFVIILRHLFRVASHVNTGGAQSRPVEPDRSMNSYMGQGKTNDIFGAQELALLGAGDLDLSCGLDFSEWVNM